MEEKSWKIHNNGTLEFRGVIFEIKDMTEVRRENICANCPFYKIDDCRSQCKNTYDACEEKPDYQPGNAVLVPKYPDIDKDVSSEEIDYKKLYEEEHKKRVDSLEKAKSAYKAAAYVNDARMASELEAIFPELKKLDEDILEGMIEHFRSQGMDSWANWLISKKSKLGTN